VTIDHKYADADVNYLDGCDLVKVLGPAMA
jgi:hypothetical protein